MKNFKFIKLFFRSGLLFAVPLLIYYFVNFSQDNDNLKKDQSPNGSNIATVLDDDRDEYQPGPKSYDGTKGFPESVLEIMERERLSEKPTGIEQDDAEEHIVPLNRSNLPSDPNAKNEATYPPLDMNTKNEQENNTDNPQTVSTNWIAATVLGTNPTNSLPADNMGAVGPTQFIVAVNGRIVTFNKSTGVADGILNASTNTFFNSVRNSAGTSDPRIRYDRVSQRWFVVIINVSTPNRILFAVSNTSSITIGTVWTFFYIPIDTQSPPISSTCLADYPTLGIDNYALYIGTNNFCGSPSQTYNSSDGYVVNKANLLAGSLTVTVFRGLATTSVEGPYTPQGVDNFDASSTEGYFIGVSTTVYSRLIIRRVSNPGGSPTVSSNINLTVNTTSNPLSVPHLGNTLSKNLDALDDRLFAACMRNGRLWTAHNIGVNSSGTTTSPNRTASRWYEIQSLTGTPSVYQSGTIYDAAASNPVSYWIPSVMVSGQGHAAFIYSSAGANNRINQSTSGRLSGGTLGTTQSVTNVTASSTAYNISETSNPHRWGDYSYVSLDPNDDMTMWGVMSFCDALNSYGVRVVKLMAPPPPPLTSANPPSIILGQSNVNVIITGTPVNGEGFFDPGAGFLNRISASISGGVVVNSVTYNSATQVTLNITTTSAVAGTKTVTITNPDGQFVSSSVIFDTPLPVLLSSFTAETNLRNVTLKWRTEQEINNRGFEIERLQVLQHGKTGEWIYAGFINGYGNTNSAKEYIFTDNKLATGKYKYRLKQIDFNGSFEKYELQSEVIIGVPGKTDVSQNYPNPFNPLTNIDYEIASDANVSIAVYDVMGKLVKQIVNEFKPAGYYTAEFDASNLASGVYFYKLVSGDFNQVKRMLVIK